MLAYNPSVTSGDSSPYTGEPSAAVFDLMVVLKLTALPAQGSLEAERRKKNGTF